jgi:hypothetical protein
MGQGWISSAQTKSREAAHLHRRIAGPIYFNFDTASSSSRHAPLHQLWRRRISGYSSSTTPDRFHQHRMWSPSPITIYINKLHHVAAITDHGHRQRQQNLLLLQLATPHNSKQKIRV